MTKKDLELQNMRLQTEILSLHREKNLISEQLKIYRDLVTPNQTMTGALETTTDALAHVIRDLIRR